MTCEVRFRLVRSDDVPATNPHNLTFHFGLQDKAENIVPGVPGPNGLLFDFTLTAKENKNDPPRPVFTGRFASGPVDDRFVYLSWRSIEHGHYINRFKARLRGIDWALVKESLATGMPITADVSGRGPREASLPVPWRVGSIQAVP